MKYLIINGCLNGSGIRDKHTEGYIDPASLNLSIKFVNKLIVWLKKYENEFYNQYLNLKQVK